MNNEELEIRIKEILKEKNFFNMIIKALEFEKEYKNSDFYKAVKMPLKDVIEKAKIFYLVDFDEIGKEVQTKLNELDTTKLMEAIDGLGNTFAEENAEILDIAKEFAKNYK